MEEEKNTNNKITILFGSGADTDCNEKLKSGDSFAEILIKSKYNKEVTAINPKIKKDIQLIYHTSTKVFLKTVETCRDLMKENDSFNIEEINMCLEYIEKKQNDEKTNVKYEQVRKICNGWYNKIFKEPENDIKNFFLENAVFFDTLDEKFNTLRNIDFTKDECRVITAYLHVFIGIFTARYGINELDFEWSYENIFKTINEHKNQEISCSDETYYNTLKESNIPCNIVTTNYTDLCEQIVGKPVTYLHGKLSWFEDLKHLAVYDCTDEKEQKEALNNKEYLIPFILIPSGVKPLICTKQIEQFHDFIQMLNKSKLLVVNGYAFNSEDNHINSIIGEWLRKCNRRKLIYFDYTEERKDNNSNNAKSIFSKINWAKDIPHTIFTDNADFNSVFKANEQIISIKVDSKNSRIVFEKFLNGYKKYIKIGG